MILISIWNIQRPINLQRKRIGTALLKQFSLYLHTTHGVRFMYPSYMYNVLYIYVIYVDVLKHKMKTVVNKVKVYNVGITYMLYMNVTIM